MSEDSQVKIVEHNEEIATRVPPGDKWRLSSDSKNIVHQSLMDVLEAFFNKTQFTGDFRFSPRGGKIYAIREKKEEILPEPEPKYNIYGDPM